MQTTATHLECSSCSTRFRAGEVHGLCVNCAKPLLVRYDLARARELLDRDAVAARPGGMWRYRELLPVADESNIVTLGEGCTPMLHAASMGERFGLTRLYVKDESVNPTGSFKARGMAAAVTMAKELGVRSVAAPSAGNAGTALAAYAARARMRCSLFMPRDTPHSFVAHARQHGADVTLIDGLITDCGAEVARLKEAEGWFDVSTLKEPYRVEGKKTLGYDLAVFLDWKLPDVIIYPTGGGTGLIGMWKAFTEMEELGWIGPKRPRMISVQAEGCAPIVDAFAAGNREAPLFPNASTVASGLRVPRAIGDFLILDAIRESRGTALAVSDRELLDGARELSRVEGIHASPEGGACVPALERLLKSGDVTRSDTVVIFNTGSGAPYLEALAAQ